MSIPVLSDPTWNSWDVITAGDGEVEISDGVVSCYASQGSQATIKKRISVKPGDSIRACVIARRTSGEGETSPKFGIDFGGIGVLVNSITIDSEEWKEYHISFTIPISAPQPTSVDVSLGSWLSGDTAGGAEFLLPKIEISNSGYGVPRVVACGLISLAGGVPSINNNFVSSGIKSLRYENSVLYVAIDSFTPAGLPNIAKISPIFLVGATTDAAPELIPKIGQFNRTTGEVQIKFADTSTGTWVGYEGSSPIFIWMHAMI